MRISDWSSDVCSSDLAARAAHEHDTLVVVITGGHGELFWQRFSGVTLDPLSEMASTPIPTLASLLPDERVFGTGAPALTAEIGRAHVCTPVTNAHLVCRLLLETKISSTHFQHTSTHLCMCLI